MSASAGDRHKLQEHSGLTFEEVFRFAYGPILLGPLLALREELGADRFAGILQGAVARFWEAEGRRTAERVPGNDLAAFKTADSPITGGLKYPARFRENALTREVIEETGRVLEIKFTECLHAKTMRELDAADIGYAIICCSDYAYCRGFNPKIKLTRTKTLMQGDDCCDFRWELED